MIEQIYVCRKHFNEIIAMRLPKGIQLFVFPVSDEYEIITVKAKCYYCDDIAIKIAELVK